jgi:hypothetical protein
LSIFTLSVATFSPRFAQSHAAAARDLEASQQDRGQESLDLGGSLARAGAPSLAARNGMFFIYNGLGGHDRGFIRNEF